MQVTRLQGHQHAEQRSGHQTIRFRPDIRHIQFQTDFRQLNSIQTYHHHLWLIYSNGWNILQWYDEIPVLHHYYACQRHPHWERCSVSATATADYVVSLLFVSTFSHFCPRQIVILTVSFLVFQHVYNTRILHLQPAHFTERYKHHQPLHIRSHN